ncbi:PilZ domain-containing protein [Desulfogranum mediterraneum]|uniref:PilZ domain-containing protein n=1 Tax=Desulfogranum mediterraneum TaxID=160661 RepID=UPI0004262BA7|nr:PilZ domain-containing protein [Desulfogranum mediterraneum]
MTEHRATKRFNLNLEATLSFPSNESTEPLSCHTRNMSSSGVFLEQVQPLRQGAEVAVEVLVPLRCSSRQVCTTLSTTGRVVRCERDGVAIQFHGQAKINQALGLQRSQPALKAVSLAG